MIIVERHWLSKVRCLVAGGLAIGTPEGRDGLDRCVRIPLADALVLACLLI